MKTSEVFAAAKKILHGPGRGTWASNEYHDYICHAINTAEEQSANYKGTYDSPAFLYARRVIQDRLGGGGREGGPHTVDTYLREVVGVPEVQVTYDNVQAYRHRWLDALIVEYQQKGD